MKVFDNVIDLSFPWRRRRKRFLEALDPVNRNVSLLFRDPRDAISQSDLDALSGGLGGEIAYLIQSVSSVMSGFLVSFIENWKITLVMMSAAPFLAIVQGIADKVGI